MKTIFLASFILALVTVNANATVTIKVNDKGEAICTVTCAKGGSWTGPCISSTEPQTGKLYSGDPNICNGAPDLNKPISVNISYDQVSEASDSILKLDLGAESYELQSGEEVPAVSESGRNFRCILE